MSGFSTTCSTAAARWSVTCGGNASLWGITGCDVSCALQSSQFSSLEKFTSVLKDAAVAISMDGSGSAIVSHLDYSDQRATTPASAVTRRPCHPNSNLC